MCFTIEGNKRTHPRKARFAYKVVRMRIRWVQGQPAGDTVMVRAPLERPHAVIPMPEYHDGAVVVAGGDGEFTTRIGWDSQKGIYVYLSLAEARKRLKDTLGQTLIIRVQVNPSDFLARGNSDYGPVATYRKVKVIGEVK